MVIEVSINVFVVTKAMMLILMEVIFLFMFDWIFDVWLYGSLQS
jgi:hypothetical protein